MGKMPINKGGYKGKYSGSAGRSYSSSRAAMSGGGGGKGPVNKSGGGGKKGCPLWVLIWVVMPITAAFVGIKSVVDWIWG